MNLIHNLVWSIKNNHKNMERCKESKKKLRQFLRYSSKESEMTCDMVTTGRTLVCKGALIKRRERNMGE